MKRLVIGMTAHVDSGKTTLSEAMLYCAGELRKVGRVDNGDAFLDTHSIERKRGITVFAKQAVMHLAGDEYTLLDTPGHVDFSAEAERALSVLDYAVLVISGTDGVQSHTETIWRLLERYNIPTFVFVNKTDISVIDADVLLGNLQSRLSGHIVRFSDEDRDEQLSLLDEDMMNEYLEAECICDDTISDKIRSRCVFPCYFGSALKLIGINDLLDGLERYTTQPEPDEGFAAQVFKITSEGGERLTHMKITGGSLRVRTQMENGEKISRIRVYSGAKFTCPEEAFAGSLCAVSGLSDTFCGQGLGNARNIIPPMLEPVLSYRVIVPAGEDEHTMLNKMKLLEQEDPQLNVMWNEQLREIHVRLMGKIQLEILQAVILERFGINVSFDRGSVAYKETISAPSLGMGHYEPLRHYAEVHLLLEPAPRGSGMIFAADCSEDVLDRNWQRLIITHLKERSHIGVLTGSPVTDIKITLITGRAHLKHTEGGDFRQATYRAVRMGLRSASSVLLEPCYDFRLEIPTECVGRAMTDLQRMCAEFSSPEIYEEYAVISGKAPVSEMAEYHSEIAAYTSGKGRLSCVFGGYCPCHNEQEIIEAIGYDADSDLENTADSVFCAHGAGFAVRWDQVKGYMHLDSGIRFGSDREVTADDNVQQSADITPAEIARYRARLYDDDELMAIFERTYGKINRDKRHAMRREPDVSKYKAKPLPKGPGFLLVDGYNIIFSWDELKKLAADNLDAARGRLTDILCNYRGFKQCEVILVFDAYKVKGTHREIEEIGGISVVYTKEAETADMYIEKVSHQLAKDNRVRVATSDGAEQMIILGSGAYRVSAQELFEEVTAVERAIRDIIEKPSAEKKTGNVIKGM